GTGAITVQASNTASVHADIQGSVKSKGTSVGVTLAFNTIGWEAQNFLYNTIDALFGTSLGTPAVAVTKAAVTNTDLHAGGAISVTAQSDASIHAEVGSSSASIGGAITQPTTVSVGAVITFNKLNTSVQASVDGASTVA